MSAAALGPGNVGGGVRHPAILPLPAAVRPYQGRRAGIISRLIASTVDFALLMATLGGIYVGLSAGKFLWSPDSFSFPTPSRFIMFATGWVIAFLYLVVAWATTGRTVGDKLLGLRVVNFRGNGMNLVGAALRAAGYLVFPIGIMWVAISRANRSIQDVLLRTSVIYDWGGAAVLQQEVADPGAN